MFSTDLSRVDLPLLWMRLMRHPNSCSLSHMLFVCCALLDFLSTFAPDKGSHKVYGSSSAFRDAMILSATICLSSLSEMKIYITSALVQFRPTIAILLTQYQIINSMNAKVNTQLLHKYRPAPSVGPRYPPSENNHEYAVTPNKTVRRTGTFASQYSRAGRASREAAVRSERPKNVRRTAMKADASLDLSIVAM